MTHAEGAAPFSYDGLDRVIHERARLGVLTCLVTHPDGLGFVELKQLCALTDGNLARHLQVLEQDGMVRLTKEDDGRRVQTTVRVTAEGHQRYIEYLAVLEQIVRDAEAARTKNTGSRLRRGLSPLLP